MTRTTQLVLAILYSMFPGSVIAQAEDTAATIDFAHDIAPIFTAHCVRCHSPNKKEGDISLATIEDLKQNEYVLAGDPDASYLVELISGAEGEPPEMPKESDPLSAEQVAAVRRWISAGAMWPDGVIVREKSKADNTWWSLQPLADVQPPRIADPLLQPDADSDWSQHPVDRFILAKLAEEGLVPNRPAERRTLIRRATYDLTGLPPTPEEVEAFVSDSDPDAYENLIDRLLDSPRYGERWGRHWLDVVRFGESRGFERNEIINDIWPFRDYVIRSFNDDKPVSQLIREHLAGDVFNADDPEIEVGSAFLVAGPYDDVGNQDAVQAAQIRANTIDEIIRTTAEAFLGLTVGCARCHDHKFDPIVQRDYYALYATFAGVRHGSRVVATAVAQEAHAAKINPLNERRSELTKQRDKLMDTVMKRAREREAEHEKLWTREPADRQGTEETFPPVETRFVRLVSEGQDANPENVTSFGIDEFEVWSVEANPRNVALAAAGAKASGPSREIEDFPGAYGPHLAIDGQSGARFLATGGQLTIELAKPAQINRVFFSSARDKAKPEFREFVFVADYRIEVSSDGEVWTEVASGRDRKPVNTAHRDKRLRELEITAEERARRTELDQQIAAVTREINAVPPLPTVWVGNRVAADAQGPFHVFIGGNPQRKGDEVVPASLSVFDRDGSHGFGERDWPARSATRNSDARSESAALHDGPQYELPPNTPEAQRRQALADWIVHPDNPLPPRVLAN